MRVVACVLLLSGLLAGLAESFSVKTYHLPVQVLRPSKGSQDNNRFDYSQKNDDGQFIASEETEEGKLWASDDDPDWTPSDSDEDYTQEDYTQEDYTQEDYTQEDYSQEDYTQEDYTQEDYSDEDDFFRIPGGGITQRPVIVVITPSPDDVISQGPDDGYSKSPDYDRTFPEILTPKAEFAGFGDFDIDKFKALQDKIPVYKDRFFHTMYRSKREVQKHHQTGQQVVQVPAAYGSEQDRLDSGLFGSIHESEGGRPGVSVGVEPLLPAGGPTLHEVSAGVEPEGVTNGKETEDSGSSGSGGWFNRGWESFLGTVDKIGDKVEDAASHVHDKLSDTVDRIHETFHGVREKVFDLVERFEVLIKKFGIVIQEGVLYCLRRFDHAIDQARESTVIEKLEKELEKGHAEVAKFFQILGEKVREWKEQHTSENIDTGLIEGHTHQDQGQLPHREDLEQEIPDFFQDPQVVTQLNKLVDVGVLTDDDVIILMEEHIVQQQHEHEHQDQEQNSDSQQQQQNQRNYYHQQSQYNPEFIQFPE